MCFDRISRNFEANRQISEVFRNDKVQQRIRQIRHFNRLENITAGYSPFPKKLTLAEKLGNLLEIAAENIRKRRIR